MNAEYIQGIEAVYNLVSQVSNEMTSLWLEHTFLTWRWWLGVSFSIVPWVFWVILRKRESTYRLLFVGFFVIIITSWLDFLGMEFGLWSYYYLVTPYSLSFFPWDFTLLPVSIMFIIQLKPQISPLKKAIGFSLFTSFVAEPFFIWVGLYNQKNWAHIYSFPIYIAIYMIADWLSRRQYFEPIHGE